MLSAEVFIFSKRSDCGKKRCDNRIKMGIRDFFFEILKIFFEKVNTRRHIERGAKAKRRIDFFGNCTI